MDEYRKIEITQPGIDPEKPVPDFKADIGKDLVIGGLTNGIPAVGAQDLNMLQESDGENF